MDKQRALHLAATTSRFPLRAVDPIYRSDPDVVLAAVQHNGLAIFDAAKELRNDRTILEAAIKEG
eukprot:6263438-Amphidinium_carterae.1